MAYAISGKERMNPLVGPVRACRPPLKFAKTGKPTAPSKIYIIVERAPFLAPSMIPASVIAKVCMVIGTPNGRGIAICASIVRIAVNKEIIQRSWIFNFECFTIKSPI